MTSAQKAAIARALLKPTRFIEIDRKADRVYRETAGINTLARLARERAAKAAAPLEAEQRRLLETWNS
jgi:hypothetical protein